MFTILLTTNSLEYTVLQVDMLYHIIVLQSNNIDHYQLILHTYLQLQRWLRHSLVHPHEVNSLQALGMGGRESSRGTSCPSLCIQPFHQQEEDQDQAVTVRITVTSIQTYIHLY